MGGVRVRTYDSFRHHTSLSKNFLQVGWPRDQQIALVFMTFLPTAHRYAHAAVRGAGMAILQTPARGS